MLTRLAIVAAAATALAVPGGAHAYRTSMCEDNGLPRDTGVSDTARTVFVGAEVTTPLHGAVGARLCFEVNPFGSHLVGYDLGIGVFYDTTSGVTVNVVRCGIPTESSCAVVLGPTGVGQVALGDLPTVGMASGCVATVAFVCVGSPSVTYGGDTGSDTITLVLNGIPVPVNVSRNCVSIPPTTC